MGYYVWDAADPNLRIEQIARGRLIGAARTAVPTLANAPVQAVIDGMMAELIAAGEAAFPVGAEGAAGDGVTDDRPAIQAAIDAAFAAGGGVVSFEAAVYRITAPLVGKAGVTLRGSVKGVFPNALEPSPTVPKLGTIIKAGAAMAAMYGFVGSVVPEEANITLENILFQCDALASGGVSVRKASDVFLTRVQVHGATTAPFVIGTAADTATGIFWAHLDLCYANGTAAPQTLYSIAATQVTLRRCLSDDGGTAVSVVGGSQNVVVDTCRFEAPTVKGIFFGDFGSSLTVKGTTVICGAASCIAVDIGESQGCMVLEDVEIQGGGYVSTIGLKTLNSGSSRGVFASNVRALNLATGYSSDSAQGLVWTGGCIDVITGGTCVSLAAGAAGHRFSDTIFRGISGATGVVAVSNASTSLTNQFNNVAMAGTVTGAGSRASVTLPESVGADRGDTSQTLAVGTDHTVQFWATTLTVNRTVTLSTTGALKGDKFAVVRTGLGAFTLDVGGLKTIPSGTAARVDVLYNGSAWVLVGYQPL